MVKDRLNEFKQRQNSDGKTRDTTINVENNSQGNDTPSGSQKLRQTFERAEVIGQWIEEIEKNNQSIRVYLRKIEDNFSQKDVEDKLKSTFQNNTSLAKQLTGKLKEIGNELVELQAESAEKRIRTIQYTTAKKRFEKAFLDNNKLLESYQMVQKKIIKAQLAIKGYFNVTDEEVSLLLEEGTDIQIFTESILAETAEAKRVLADVEERHQQLLQIERMLTEVHDMFVQMSILVDTQQELVDRIEYQAQQASDHIGSGAVELEAAKKSKKKSTKMKIYIMIGLLILLAIILIVLFKG